MTLTGSVHFFVSHVYREWNHYSDALAKKEIECNHLNIWMKVPDCIRTNYVQHKLGMPNFRFVPWNGGFGLVPSFVLLLFSFSSHLYIFWQASTMLVYPFFEKKNNKNGSGSRLQRQSLQTFMSGPNIKKKQNIFKINILNLRVKYVLVLLIQRFGFILYRILYLIFAWAF